MARFIANGVRIALISVGLGIGLLSWVLFFYATITLLMSAFSKWGAIVYGGALILELIGVGAALWGDRRSRRGLFTTLGVAGWLCAVANLLILNAYPAVL
jgi:hypothetical protein